MSSKFPLFKWKTYFSQFIDKFLKIEEVKYLNYYVKFKIWPVLFYVNSQNFWMGFSRNDRGKKLEFSRLGPAW